MIGLPSLALSVRQPWAWAIIHAGKDVENRIARAIGFMKPLVGRRAIHASKGITRREYIAARDFMATLGIACPPPAELQRGGIIGSVAVVGRVKQSDSRWFFGPHALILSAPRACDFIGAQGELGYFKWKPNGADADEPFHWMMPPTPLLALPDLFDAAGRR